MPMFRNRTVVEVARGLRAFVNLDVGLTRGEAPDPERQLGRARLQLEQQGRQLERLQRQLRAAGQTSPKLVARPPGDSRRRVDPSRRVEKASEKDPDWHRRAVGGRWEEIGQLQFDFLVEQGLKPQHLFLDVGCGSLRGGVRFIPYLEPGHYYGVDRSEPLLAAGHSEVQAANLQDRRPTLSLMDDFGFERLNRKFDYALAQSVFTHLPLNSITRCLVNMDRALRPGGVFFATFFENRGGKGNLGPIEQGDGVVSHYDRDPYHYTHDAFVWACEGTGLEVEHVGDWGHPRNQLMLAFHKGGT